MCEWEIDLSQLQYGTWVSERLEGSCFVLGIRKVYGKNHNVVYDCKKALTSNWVELKLIIFNFIPTCHTFSSNHLISDRLRVMLYSEN